GAPVWRWLCPAVALLVAVVGGGAADATQDVPGRLLFARDGDLWLLDSIGAHQVAIGGALTQPTWAPDGSTLAYVYRGTNFADIFVTDDQGQSLTRLTNSQSTILDNNDWNLRPTFSPDGKLIAFVSDKTSTFPTLWLMNSADGSGRHALATGLQEEGVDTLAWSPDGSSGTRLTRDGILARSPVWSPDGRQLAYLSSKTGYFEVWAIDIKTDESGALMASSPRQLTQDLHVDAASGLSWGRTP